MERKKPKGFDIVGNIAIVKFLQKTSAQKKKKFAENLLRKNKSVRTVLEKTGKFKGRLRRQKTKHLSGVRTKEVLYRENNCVFRFNIDKTYFSPRLSNERKEIAGKMKRDDEVLVMFAGVAPYSIVIAKNSKARKVYSSEINREANKYAKLNVELNKVKDKVQIIQGDVKGLTEKLSHQSSSYLPTIKNVTVKKVRSLSVNNLNKKANEAINFIPRKFDVIVMPRPQLKEIFLKEAFGLSKKGTRIFYYGFCKEEEISSLKEIIKEEAKKSGKKIKILNVKKAGEIAPYKFRVRVDFKVLA